MLCYTYFASIVLPYSTKQACYCTDRFSVFIFLLCKTVYNHGIVFLNVLKSTANNNGVQHCVMFWLYCCTLPTVTYTAHFVICLYCHCQRAKRHKPFMLLRTYDWNLSSVFVIFRFSVSSYCKTVTFVMCVLILSSLIYLPTDAPVSCLRNNIKIYIETKVTVVKIVYGLF
jgi:hypothetical protein